jgi:hypothetical protein
MLLVIAMAVTLGYNRMTWRREKSILSFVTQISWRKANWKREKRMEAQYSDGFFVRRL